MDPGLVTKTITKILNKYNIEEEKVYDAYNIYTLFKIQRDNSVGKTDVGIAANGVKAAGAL